MQLQKTIISYFLSIISYLGRAVSVSNGVVVNREWVSNFCVILNEVKNLRSIEGAKILRLHFVSLRMTREVEGAGPYEG